MKTIKSLLLLGMILLLQTTNAQEYDLYFPNNETLSKGLLPEAQWVLHAY